MFKKLNAWLITRYPLFWNTRVVFVLPLVLLVHGLFYLAGYSQLIELSDFYTNRIFRAEDVILFSCLISVVILLIWLIFYLRNNPLKAHYPVSKKYMFGEFLLLFLVFFSSATFFFTYRQGVYDQGRRVAANTDLAEEANTVNLAFHFIPMYSENFEWRESCANFDPLVNTDSATPSYLNYCQLRINDLETATITSREENSKRAISWLKEGRKDSVRYVLTRLQELLQKYEVDHLYDPIAQADSVFANPGFAINTFPFYPNRYDFESQDTLAVFLIEYGGLSLSFDKIEEVREGFWDYGKLLGLLYYALGAAIVLYSFRMMKARIWFAALIGVGLWAIVLGLLFSLSDMEAEGVFSVFLFLFLAFLALAAWLILGKENKFISGLTFSWAIWSQLAVLPLVIALAMEFYKYEQRVVETVNGPVVEEIHTACYTWFNDNIEHIFASNLGLFLVLLFLVYIPLARRWQANPEE